MMPDSSPSRVYAFLKDILPFFKNNVYSPGPKMPDLRLLHAYTLFSNFPFSSSKKAYTFPRPAYVYAPMKKALYHFNNSVYVLQGGRPSMMPDLRLLHAYTLFSNFPFSSSKIAYTLPRPTVYTPLYRKPFAILKITYTRHETARS